MNARILSPAIHGVLDYAAAAALIAAPFVLDLGATSPIALWLSGAGGIGLSGYSQLTDYSYAAVRLLPFNTHLALDLAAGATFVAAPFVFGWSGVTAWYYVVMGAGVAVVVALSAHDGARVASEAG